MGVDIPDKLREVPGRGAYGGDMKVNRNSLPRFDSRKEYESPIHEYRVAAGLTIKELAKQAGVHASQITGFANGMESPVYERTGQIKTGAQRLCAFFNVDPADLFPRYICTIDKTYKFDCGIFESWSERVAEDHADKIQDIILARYLINTGLSKVSARERRVFLHYLYNGESTVEIAEKERLSRNRVAQLLNRSLRRIRFVANKLQIADCLFPTLKELAHA